MRIIGMTGKAGAGKDTMADYLVDIYGYTKVSMAGPLKAMLAAAGLAEPTFRVDKENLIPGFNFTWRLAAQRLGTEWGRGLDPDIWVKLMALHLARGGRYVISDIRFDNEAEMVRGMGGMVLHVVGRAADLGDAAAHASEAGVQFEFGTDSLIDNNHQMVDAFAQLDAVLGSAA